MRPPCRSSSLWVIANLWTGQAAAGFEQPVGKSREALGNLQTSQATALFSSEAADRSD